MTLAPFDKAIFNILGAQPTECSCTDCQRPCQHMPGMCVPGDAERIMDFLGLPMTQAPKWFNASPGAKVGTVDGRTWRIGTIVPAVKSDGSCVHFNQSTGKCQIHEVAPFGCRYFDWHMSKEEGDQRSCFGLAIIPNADGYKALRERLIAVGSVTVPPEIARERMEVANASIH